MRGTISGWLGERIDSGRQRNGKGKERFKRKERKGKEEKEVQERRREKGERLVMLSG